LESDKWMKRYEAFRDDLMDKVENPDKEVGARVKIAILDTGIDWEHPYIKGAEDQIKKSRNFVGDRPGQDGKEQVKDDAGHGTHTAALLLKTVPGADIYIARVTAKTGIPLTQPR
jgi:subtilisin family serine protease